MKSLKSIFFSITGSSFFLEENNDIVEAYLKSKGWLSTDDAVLKIEKPGEGNMNCVLRVLTTRSKSFILKQARPWVEKYPQVVAPVERISIEHMYFREVSTLKELAQHSPNVIGFDESNLLLLMEDFVPLLIFLLFISEMLFSINVICKAP